jgi:hypothetical protein
MQRWLPWVVFLLVVASVPTAVYFAGAPYYGGHSLMYWVETYRINGAPPNGDIIDADAKTKEAMRHLGSRAVPKLVSIVEARNGELRSTWKKILAKIPWVKKSTLNNMLPVKAAKALGDIGPEASPASPLLVEMLKDTPFVNRAVAVIALGQIHSDPGLVVPALTNCLVDRTAHVREMAARGLGEFGPRAKPAVPHLIEATKSNDYFLRLRAMTSLEQIDPPSAARQKLRGIVKEWLE